MPCAAVGDLLVVVNGRSVRGLRGRDLPALFAPETAADATGLGDSAVGAAGDAGGAKGAGWVRVEVLSARQGTAETAVAGGGADSAPYRERPRHVHRHAFMLRRCL